MNNKQLLVIAIGVAGIAVIAYFAPRYKIIKINERDFIATEQSSVLYARSKGQVQYHWDKIALYSGLLILTCGAFVFIFRKKNG